MNYTLFVRCFEGFSNLEREFEGLFDRDRTTLEPVGQGVAFDEFEDQEACAVVFFEAWIVAMFGWFNDASSFASRSNRASRSSSLANSSGRVLIATSRPSLESRARHTSPMPPLPRAETTS